MPLFTPIRKTAGRLELTHFPASCAFVGGIVFVLLLGLIAFTFVRSEGPNGPPEFVRWLGRVVAGFFICIYIRNLFVEKRVADVAMDLVSKRMTIARRPQLSLGVGPHTPEKEEYSLEEATKVVLRATTVTTALLNKEKRERHYSLCVVKSDGEEISLFGRDYTIPIWGGKAIGREIADFLGVEFAVE